MNTEIINYDEAIIEVETSHLEGKGWEFDRIEFHTGKVRYYFVDGVLARTLYPADKSDVRNAGKFPHSSRPFCDHDELIAALKGVPVKVIRQYNYPDSPRNI